MSPAPSNPTPQPRKLPALSAGTWATLAGLVLIYGPLLYHWVHGWLFKSVSIEHEYYSHGMLGLPLAAYYVWQQRPRWTALPDRHNLFGAVLLGFAAALYFTGLADLVNLSLWVLLVGLALWLKGGAGLKLQAFALVLVLLATPTDLPYLVTTQVLPLQQAIASLIGLFLNLVGKTAVVDSIYVYFPDGATIEVAPYCAGLKLLFTNVYVVLMLLYWTGVWRSLSRSLTLVGLTVFLSFWANVGRNTVLSLFHGGGNADAFHWLHDGWGGDVFSLVMLGGVFWMLTAIERYWPLPQGGADADAPGLSAANS
ncbi:MAG: cyanoexosortase B [Synechococcales cyanobacterium RM1_1_8]|nr:cyanoexosortase B [Synechococcales cyanobacterium RM1_1_8]